MTASFTKIIFSVVFFLAIGTSSQGQTIATLYVGSAEGQPQISRHIYGMFSEHLGRDIYDGFWVGEGSEIPNTKGIRNDLVEAFRKIKIPILRWPGGCFADDYHWMDGIGPKAQRPETVNTHWGMVTEDNSFGSHEFMELCELLGTEAYFASNVGSGTEKELSQWIEYMNSNQQSDITALRKKNGREQPWKVEYWGIGNENWGCGGNMTPEHYSDLYRRYATYARNYPGAPIKRIASGPNGNDTHWMEVLMKNIPHGLMWGISLHYYTIPTGNWSHKGSATQFDEKEYFSTMKNALFMEQLLNNQEDIMDRYDPKKSIALVVDEWGIWTDAEPGTNPAFLYQQNSLRDALLAASTLNIFNNHADRVRMANLAQTVNVLQSLALTRGKEMILTPTYHVFDLFKVHQNATLLPVKLISPDYEKDGQKIPAINVSASKDSSDNVHLTFVNLDPSRSIMVNTTLSENVKEVTDGKILTSDHFNDVNTFENPWKVKPIDFKRFQISDKSLKVNIPARSIVELELK